MPNSAGQKGNQIQNNRARIVVQSINIDLSAGAAQTAFPRQPAVAGRRFRIFEIGYTNTVANSVAVSGDIDVGTVADPNKYIAAAQIPAAFPTVGFSISNFRRTGLWVASKGWSFAAAGKNTDGDMIISPGDQLVYTVAAAGGALGEGFLWMLLDPLDWDMDK